jgi:hypothetical protein
MTAGGVDVLAGLWLVLSPFILGFSGTALSTSNVILGIAVTVIAIIQLSTNMGSNWLGWLNGLFGLWVLVSPFILGALMAAAIWNNVIVGLVVVILSIWGTTSATIGHGQPKMG